MKQKIFGIFSFFKAIIRKKFTSPYVYAKCIGVNIGKGCFVPDKDCWSSEPYLITVGHCQITSGVRLFTHGGERCKMPNTRF